MGSPPPPIRGPKRGSVSLDPSTASGAIELVRRAVPFMTVGPPIIRYGPAGEVHVDVPIMYQSFALDRVHYDPVLKAPSPKGRPARAWGVRVDPNEVISVMERIIKELDVVEAVEFREPELAWVVPLRWGPFIVAHIKVSHDAKELIPDYGLTEELRRQLM